MIVVFKLYSGDEVIGRLDAETDEEFDNLEYYELKDPMWIVPTEGGAMKLRDACMLSLNEGLIFHPESIITCYKPIVSLINYYNKASTYSAEFTRESIANQIDLATYELEQMMQEEKEYAAKMGAALRKVTGSKLH